MENKESKKIREIETRLAMVRNTYENLLPIYYAIDRKRLSLECEVKMLENERLNLLQGQLIFEGKQF